MPAPTTPTPNERNTLTPNERLKAKLREYGYDGAYIEEKLQTPEGRSELLEDLKTAQDREINYADRTRDRKDSLQDFQTNLNLLTGSKQRQAEQQGRIAQSLERTRGLSGMMANF